MSSELGLRMAEIKTLLAAAYPSRFVTRDLKDSQFRTATELTSGIYTIFSLDELNYQNLQGRLAMDGMQHLRIVGQFALAETAAPHEIEDAEFVMAEEIKAFVRTLPADAVRLVMNGFRQSGQMDHPNGWISVDLTFNP